MAHHGDLAGEFGNIGTCGIGIDTRHTHHQRERYVRRFADPNTVTILDVSNLKTFLSTECARPCGSPV